MLSFNGSLSLVNLDPLSSNLRASNSSLTRSVQHFGGLPLLALLGKRLCKFISSWENYHGVPSCTRQTHVRVQG